MSHHKTLRDGIKFVIPETESAVDMNDGDKREGETVGSTCAWCGGAVVILKVHGEATIQGNDSAEEDALATLANA